MLFNYVPETVMRLGVHSHTSSVTFVRCEVLCKRNTFVSWLYWSTDKRRILRLCPRDLSDESKVIVRDCFIAIMG